MYKEVDQEEGMVFSLVPIDPDESSSLQPGASASDTSCRAVCDAEHLLLEPPQQMSLESSYSSRVPMQFAKAFMQNLLIAN